MILLLIEVTITISNVRTYKTIRTSQLEQLHLVAKAFLEVWFFRNHITHTHCREETKAIVLTEAVGTIIGSIEID